jgi:hypothetical protein
VQQDRRPTEQELGTAYPCDATLPLQPCPWEPTLDAPLRPPALLPPLLLLPMSSGLPKPPARSNRYGCRDAALSSPSYRVEVSSPACACERQRSTGFKNGYEDTYTHHQDRTASWDVWLLSKCTMFMNCAAKSMHAWYMMSILDGAVLCKARAPASSTCALRQRHRAVSTHAVCSEQACKHEYNVSQGTR